MAARRASAGENPQATIRASSVPFRPARLNGVPQSVPKATRTPASRARLTLFRCHSTTWTAFLTTWAAMPAAVPCSTMVWPATRVGTRKVPRSAVKPMASSSSMVPCSTVSSPTRTAATTPAAPWQWPATRRPSWWACSMAAWSSSGVHWRAPTSEPSVMTPPVTRSLMTSARILTIWRTASRAATGPATIPSRGTETPGR